MPTNTNLHTFHPDRGRFLDHFGNLDLYQILQVLRCQGSQVFSLSMALSFSVFISFRVCESLAEARMLPEKCAAQLLEVLRATGLVACKIDVVADAAQKLDGITLSAANTMSWEQLEHVSESGKAALKAAGLLPSTGKHLLEALGYVDADDLEVRTTGRMHAFT